VFELLLTGLTRVNGVFELPLGDVVETHANQIVWREPRHHISLFNQLEPQLEMLASFIRVALVLS
jgi:hypothetical protein